MLAFELATMWGFKCLREVVYTDKRRGEKRRGLGSKFNLFWRVILHYIARKTGVLKQKNMTVVHRVAGFSQQTAFW